jgi:hypothetical protein
MGFRATVSAIFVVLGALTISGCAAPEKPVETPASGVPESCDRRCNSEYDACMDRFEGVPGTHNLGHPDDPNNMLGPNGVCPDQLKSCLKRCSL